MVAFNRKELQDDFDRNDCDEIQGDWCDCCEPLDIKLTLVPCNCELCQLCRAEYDIEISE